MEQKMKTEKGKKKKKKWFIFVYSESIQLNNQITRWRMPKADKVNRCRRIFFLWISFSLSVTVGEFGWYQSARNSAAKKRLNVILFFSPISPSSERYRANDTSIHRNGCIHCETSMELINFVFGHTEHRFKCNHFRVLQSICWLVD